MAKIHSSIQRTSVMGAIGLSIKTAPVTVASLATGIIENSDRLGEGVGYFIDGTVDALHGFARLAKNLPERAIMLRSESLSEACGEYISVRSLLEEEGAEVPSWVDTYDRAARAKFQAEHLKSLTYNK